MIRKSTTIINNANVTPIMKDDYEVRPEYLRKLEEIEKEEGIKFSSFEELMESFEVDE